MAKGLLGSASLDELSEEEREVIEKEKAKGKKRDGERNG